MKYIFKAYYYDSTVRTITVESKTSAGAYDRARKKAIRIKNDLDLIELNKTI